MERIANQSEVPTWSKIISKSDLFAGEEVEQPPLSLLTGRENKDGYPLVFCPHCASEQDTEHCDVLGAEPYCRFCLNCNGEFEVAW